MVNSLVSPLKAYVTRLERRYFDPCDASCEVMYILNKTVSNVFNKATRQSCDVSQVEDKVSMQIDRFWAWTNRKIISVKEACRIFKRSRSTIYRWIKQGKLANAIKEHGKWRIAI